MNIIGLISLFFIEAHFGYDVPTWLWIASWAYFFLGPDGSTKITLNDRGK